MTARRRRLGQRGEARAAAHVASLGWPILARNWRTRGGELDLVARDGTWLVVIEVRSRAGRRFGTPEESVDVRKQRQLLALGARYVQQVGWRGPWRIDVIALEWPDPSAERKKAAREGARGAVGLPSPDPAAPARPTAAAPDEHLQPDGVRLRHLRHAVSP